MKATIFTNIYRFELPNSDTGIRGVFHSYPNTDDFDMLFEMAIPTELGDEVVIAKLVKIVTTAWKDFLYDALSDEEEAGENEDEYANPEEVERLNKLIWVVEHGELGNDYFIAFHNC